MKKLTVKQQKINKNAHRIYRMLQASSIGESRRYIMESLGLTQNEYDDASDLLVKQKAAKHNRGRFGGLYIPTTVSGGYRSELN